MGGAHAYTHVLAVARFDLILYFIHTHPDLCLHFCLFFATGSQIAMARIVPVQTVDMSLPTLSGSLIPRLQEVEDKFDIEVHA